MEILETDSLTKSAKKKKDLLDEQARKNIRKISDFFKTPEKQVEKQRQKSLLQFFGKSGQEDEGRLEGNVVAHADEVIANGTEVTTPTNSDKENNDVVDVNGTKTDKVESKSKSKKKQRGSESSNDDNNSGLQLKYSQNDCDAIETKRHKKHKKSKSKEDGPDDNMSDSVILLSDSSSSNLLVMDCKESNIESNDILGVNSVTETHKVVDSDKVKTRCDQRVEAVEKDEEVEITESGGESEMVVDDVEIEASKIERGDFSDKKEVIVMKDNREEKALGKISLGVCNKDEIKVDKMLDNDIISEATNGMEAASEKSLEKEGSDKQEKRKKLKKSAECKKMKNMKSESLNAVNKSLKEGQEGSAEKAEKTKQKDKQEGLLKSEKRKSKKGALKGKDMLDLLKEIQSAESEDKNKRKHKKKHKHHKTKEKQEKEVLEIAVSEDNSDCKEEVKEVENDIVDKKHKILISAENEEDKADTGTGNKNENGMTRRKSTVREGKEDVNNGEQTESNIEEVTKKSKPDKIKLKRGRPKKKELKVSSAPGDSNQLSYTDFTETLDSRKSQTQEKSEDHSTKKEMSYTEYLQLMEKANAGDSVDLCESDNENVTEASDQKDKIPEENVNSSRKSDEDIPDDDLIPENSNIKKFFSVMTSTPDREKINKKTGKVKKVGKSKTSKLTKTNIKSKITNKAEPDTECEKIENKKELEVDLDMEIVDVENKATESQSEVIEVDVPNKSLFSIKKTQATLSFGKSGLTVSKPVIKSDEEEPKDRTSKKSVTADEIEKQKGCEVAEVKAATPKRGRKSRKDTVDLNATDSSVFATPENAKKTKKRKLEEEESESAGSGDRRRSLRKRYKVEAFQMDADKKTPIKIKLKRCPKSSSSGEDIEKSASNVRKVKPTVNQTTAQALLEKAKRGKLKKHKMKKDKETFSLKKQKESKKQKKNPKTRNESNSSEDSVTRRSSRLEGRVMASMEEVSLENIMISSSEDEGEDVKVVKKRGRPKGSKKVIGELTKKFAETGNAENKGTPKKQNVKKKIGTPSKNKTPLKKTGKLAPMFLMGKNKPTEPSPKKPPLDPELVKQRQQFLMSGVPDELRKQTATRIALQVDADYPPIPRTSHVQQAPTDCVAPQNGRVNVWDLSPVELTLRPYIIPVTVHPLAGFSGDLMSRNENKSVHFDRIKNFKHPVQISDDMIEICQKEIACFNSTYPVTTMYKALKEMKTETEKPPPKSESMLKTDMKGILDGCTDMVVIDDEAEEDQGKKKKKKSLKLQKKDQIEQKVEEPKVEEKPKVTGSSLLWTEKYCPAKTAEVLGNSGVLKRLKTWLTEWKHVLDREARKAQKLLMKKNKGKQLPSKNADADDLWDDDSDFDMDSDDSDDDDSLCNTMLLSGPHGCGKTSSVYALALELGFKVHEVNASSCRSGKQILSQLQEATQSHQVSSQGNHTPRKNTALGDKPKTENKMPTAFTNLFKKAAAPAADSKQEEKQAGRKRKRNKSDKESDPRNKREKRGTEIKHKSLQLVIEDSNSQSAAKSLNLSSTTLILFDEVDVVFDEDRGFLSAIQNFMSNTKIPIVLTTADPGFTDTFDGRYEQMNFKRPSVGSITTHLQTVSLVENVRTDPIMLAELAQFYNCDMRRCLVALQYLLESGGGHTVTHKAIEAFKIAQKTAGALGLEMENSQSSLQSDSCVTLRTENKFNVEDKKETSRDVDNSDDDFVSIKPLKKRRRVLEDDNSNSVDANSQVTLHRPTEVIAVDNSEERMNFPPVHSIGLESLMGCKETSIADFLTQGLKAKSAATLQDMICTCHCIKQNSGTDLFYNNLHIVLPFTTKIVDSVFKVSQDCSNSKTKKRKRIRIDSDLFDSEASNDASNAEHSDDKQEESVESDRAEAEKLLKGSKMENLCLAKSLSHFSRFYDTMSSLDVLESNDRKKVCDKMQSLKGRDVKGTLVAGVGNELANFPTHCELDLDTSRMYSSEIETRSICKLYKESMTVKEEVEKLNDENEAFAEDFELPVSRQNETFTLVDNSSISIPAEYKRACDNTVDNLPLVSHSHLRTVHIDYLPTLREICRTEQCRQVTNTKRRFHHYMDSITLPLKDRTMSTLATTFV